MASRLGLGAIAITDHDTVAGLKAAMALEIPPDLRFLPGIEISTAPPPSFEILGSYHLLGYGIQPDHPALIRELNALQQARQNRNPQILERLRDLGMEISYDQLQAAVGGGQIGRPHIARQMIRQGYVGSINEAFDRYLATGQPAYVDKYRIACDRAIALILEAGGIPVAAHPYLYESEDPNRTRHYISSLIPMGLRGIEVHYSDHTPEQTARYRELAHEFGLLMTGGSDYHGTLKPDVQMGSGRGDLAVPYDLFEALDRALNAKVASQIVAGGS